MHKAVTEQELFSKSLHAWLKSSKDKSLRGLIKMAGEKSFAIVFVTLMALPALPLPTGGVTHVTEILTVIGSLQLIIGRRTVWVPKRWMKLDVGKFMTGKAASKLISVIEWFEGWSRRRWNWLLIQRPVVSLLGIIITIFTIAAFVAPPFSGLDTLPALGVVIISLGLIMEDALMVGLGIVVGSIGIGVEIAAGTALYGGLTHFL